MPADSQTGTVIDDVVCAFCGCVCDDLSVTVEEGQVTKVKKACALGQSWLKGHSAEGDRPEALIDGHAASLDEAIEVAAKILVEARYPLIYGLSSTFCEAQRQAVALADTLHATLDCCTSVCHGPSGIAVQGVGEPTCTLGEVKNRGDLLIYWGANPAESHPRHFSRYSSMPKGLFTPLGRKGRTVVVVDVRPTKTSRAADIFLQIKLAKDFEVIWALRALIRGIEIEESAIADTGLTLAQLQDLADRMKACEYGVVFGGQGLTQGRGKHLNTEAVFLLCRDLYAHTKFSAIPMRGHGNVTGVDAVVAWQTGYPFGVNFSRGYPRFNPGEYTAVDVLSRGEADAALIAAADPVAVFPRAAIERLKQIPVIALDTHESETTKVAKVAFTVATTGVHAEGTIYRMDGVPLRTRQVLPSKYPTDEVVFSRLLARVKQLSTE